VLAPVVGAVLVPPLVPPMVVPPDLAGAELAGAELDTGAGGLDAVGPVLGAVTFFGGAFEAHAAAEESAVTLVAAGELAGPPLWPVPGAGVVVGLTDAGGELLGGPDTGGEVEPVGAEVDGLGLTEPVAGLDLPALGVGAQGVAAGETPAV
jgi:hypothetical protein